MSTDKKRRSSKGHESIDRSKLLKMLTAEFPEVSNAFDESVKGLLHCEMGTFARLTEQAMDEGRFWQVDKYFGFIENVRKSATAEVKNAIDVSYIEYLAFSEVTSARHKAMKRMPKLIRSILLKIDGRNRWA